MEASAQARLSDTPRVLLTGLSGPVQALTQQVSKAGYDVLVERTEAEAVERVSHEAVDALICQIHSAPRRVFHFLQQLRKVDSAACVILVGPDQGAEETAGLLRAGAFDYLTVPVVSARLEDSLRQGLATRRSFLEVRELSGQLQHANEDLAKERDSLEQWNRNLMLLNQLGQDMAGSLRADEIIPLLGSRLSQIVKFQQLGVVWLEPEEVWVYGPSIQNGRTVEVAKRTLLTRGRELRAKAGISEGNDRQSNRQDTSLAGLGFTCGPHSLEGGRGERLDAIELPLLVAKRLVGFIRVECVPGMPFDEPQLELFKTVATSLALSLRNVEIHNHMQTLAMTDSLTNLLNRRAFTSIFTREFREAERYCTPLCLIMVDLDHFKKTNDEYGHVAGDHILKDLAALLGQSIRAVDIVTRFGGEEFALILPRTDLPQATILANRLRSKIESHEFAINGTSIHLTVSMGIAR
ncbi:MAG: diguanylate cyclase, partial [Nitrospiraceae bacterium]